MADDELQPSGYWLIETPVTGRVLRYRRMEVGTVAGTFADEAELELMTGAYIEDVVSHPERHLSSSGSPLALIERVPVASRIEGAFIGDGVGGWLPFDPALLEGDGPSPSRDVDGPTEMLWADIALHHPSETEPDAPLGPILAIGQTVASVEKALEIAADHHFTSGELGTVQPAVSVVITRVRHGDRDTIIVPPVGPGQGL